MGSLPYLGFALWEGLCPFPVSCSPCLMMLPPPGVPSAAQAESGPDPTRESSRPDAGFARSGKAATSPASIGFGPATPLPPGAPLDAQAASGPDPTGVSSRPDRGFARWGGYALQCVARLRPCNALASWHAFGRAGCIWASRYC